MKSIENLSINIKNLLNYNKISESELARITSVSQPIINRLAQGVTTNPNINTLRPIAKYFNITIEQLIGDRPLFNCDQNELTENSILSSNWLEVPLIEWEMAKDWKGIPKEKERVCFLNFKLDFTENAYSLLIEDSSMEPTFLKSSYIIVEPDFKPIDKDFVLIYRSDLNKPFVRQILYSGDEVFLKPVNPEFKMKKFTKNFDILGVIIRSYSILRS